MFRNNIDFYGATGNRIRGLSTSSQEAFFCPFVYKRILDIWLYRTKVLREKKHENNEPGTNFDKVKSNGSLVSTNSDIGHHVGVR